MTYLLLDGQDFPKRIDSFYFKTFFLFVDVPIFLRPYWKDNY